MVVLDKLTAKEQQQLELCNRYEEEAVKSGSNILRVLNGCGGYFVEVFTQDEDCDNEYMPWKQYDGMFASKAAAERALISAVVNDSFYAAPSM